MTAFVFVSLVPTTSLIAFSDSKFEFIYLNFLYWVLLLSLQFIIPSLVWQKGTSNGNKLIRNAIIIALCAAVIFISFKYTGFRLHFGFSDVYDLRLEAREFEMPSILAYLQTAANTILPIIFIYYIVNKRKLYAVFIAFIIFLNFGIAGGKSVILLLFIAFIGYFLAKSLTKSLFLVWGFILLVAIPVFEFALFGTYYLYFFNNI